MKSAAQCLWQVNVADAGLDEVNLTPLQWCFEASHVIPWKFGFCSSVWPSPVLLLSVTL